MAAAFALVASFPRRDPGIERARAAIEARPTLRVREADVPIELQVADRPHDGLSECAVAVTAVAPPVWPQTWDGEATAAELWGVAGQLYEVLRRFDGYLLARVGWDPQESVRPHLVAARLREDGLWKQEGLVVADHLAAGWGIHELLEPFAPGYRWHPYEA